MNIDDFLSDSDNNSPKMMKSGKNEGGGSPTIKIKPQPSLNSYILSTQLQQHRESILHHQHQHHYQQQQQYHQQQQQLFNQQQQHQQYNAQYNHSTNDIIPSQYAQPSS